MTIKTKPFDAAKYLTTPEAVKAFVDDYVANDSANELFRALTVVGGVAIAALGAGWRPISEAPKDGSSIFAADANYNKGIAYWHVVNPCWGHEDYFAWHGDGRGNSEAAPVYYLPAPPSSTEAV